MASTKQLVFFALLLIFAAGGSIDGVEGNRVSIKANLNAPCGSLCMRPYCHCDGGVCDCSALLDPARIWTNAHSNQNN
ncbi:hypothetical protein LINGRAHAP2_LOCUS33856 [Linum grandiflorum]